jgi:hypothetical protein
MRYKLGFLRIFLYLDDTSPTLIRIETNAGHGAD